MHPSLSDQYHGHFLCLLMKIPIPGYFGSPSQHVGIVISDVPRIFNIMKEKANFY